MSNFSSSFIFRFNSEAVDLMSNLILGGPEYSEAGVQSTILRSTASEDNPKTGFFPEDLFDVVRDKMFAIESVLEDGNVVIEVLVDLYNDLEVVVVEVVLGCNLFVCSSSRLKVSTFFLKLDWC